MSIPPNKRNLIIEETVCFNKLMDMEINTNRYFFIFLILPFIHKRFVQEMSPLRSRHHIESPNL